MPYEIMLDELPMGFVIDAARAGETVALQVTGFLSSEDGQSLVTYLEQLPSILLAKAVGDRVRPSQVDNLLAIIRRDKTARVYVNELRPTLLVRVAQAKQRGDSVTMGEMTDVEEARLGVEIPPDAAVVFVFSWGWRKGYFYDLAPLDPEYPPRDFDLPVALGELYARLLFQERYNISDAEWASLFRSGWFPFAGLGNETFSQMLAHLRADWDLDELAPRIAEETGRKAPDFLRVWRVQSSLASHGPVLEEAVARFQSGDYLGCVRSLHPLIGDVLRPLIAVLGGGRPGSLLMPQRFAEYLDRVYLPSFAPSGEGTESHWRKASVVSLLAIQQLSHVLEVPVRVKSGRELARPQTDAGDAAERWSRWSANGTDESLALFIDRLDASLPAPWRRVLGEGLARFGPAVRPGAAFYSLEATTDHVGVAVCVEREAGRMRGGRVWFGGPPHPPTATVPAAWGQVVRLLDEGIVPAARAAGVSIYAPDADALFLAELPPDVADALVRFSRSARKSLPLAGDDARRWDTFVLGAFRSRAVLDGPRLVEWLVREGWDRTPAAGLDRRLNDECRLLGRFTEEAFA